MLHALTVLLLCQFAGEMISSATGIPVPGPVLGLVILLLLQILLRGRVVRVVQSTSEVLLQNLALLFVPAGVGVIDHLDILARNWLPVVVSIAVSTLLGLAVTAWVMQRLLRAEPEPLAAVE